MLLNNLQVMHARERFANGDAPRRVLASLAGNPRANKKGAHAEDISASARTRTRTRRPARRPAPRGGSARVALARRTTFVGFALAR